jgi:hypothetical protein
MFTVEAQDYERFTYDDPNGPPLALDEAVKKATELRRTDPKNFYRVEATDSNATGFRIEKVSVASVYAEFIARFAQRFVRRSVTKSNERFGGEQSASNHRTKQRRVG